MTIDELKSYKALKAEYAELTLNVHSVSDSVQGSMQDYPCSRRIDGTEMGSVEILRRMSDIKHKISEIENYINSIEDIQIRSIFRMKYINGKTNQNIAMKLGYRDEGTIRKKIRKYF